MSEVQEVLRMLARINRDRALVKTALISEDLRAKLLADLDAQVAKLSLKTTPEPAKGK